MTRIAGVLFDKDGVLVDFHRTWGPAAARVMRHFAADEAQVAALAQAVDFDLATERFLPSSVFIAGTGADTLRAWAPILKIDSAMAMQIFERMTAEGLDCVATAPEVPRALHALRNAGLPLGIATNDQADSARQQMIKLDLVDLFETISGADSGYGAKPGPGMIDAFATHLEVDTARIVMVGDSTHDLHAARNAGAIGVGIGTGPASLDSLAPHADHVIETMAELPDLVERLG